MPDIVWEDPPAPHHRQRWTADFADECRKHPGKWAKVTAPDGRDEQGTNVVSKFREYGLELRTTRRNPNGTKVRAGCVLMWARWPDE